MESNFLQSQAPLFEELLRYGHRPLISIHTTGHKAGLGLPPEWNDLKFPAGLDLTEIPAFDWDNSWEKAERLAAEFFRSDRAFFLTQGASQGNIGGILGVFSPGDKVLVGRNCHQSVIHGLILARLDPIYIETEFLPEFNIATGTNPDSLKQQVERNPDFKGLIITNPSYQGVVNQLKVFREIIGDRILFIDEAHGGHFGWMGFSGYDAHHDADIWVHGNHKIFGSFTQTGMLHIKRRSINQTRVKAGLDLIATTSPSYILLASLDSNRRWLSVEGARLFKEKLPVIQEFKKRLTRLKGIEVLTGAKFKEQDRIVDPWKICIRFQATGKTGYQAETILREKYRIQAEYADSAQVTFLAAPWQVKQDLAKLEFALTELSKSGHCDGDMLNMKNRLDIFAENRPSSIPPLMMRPSDAWMGPSTLAPFERAAGRISAAIISHYPPGIPLIAPGELIREDEVQYIRKITGNRERVTGINPDGTIRVTAC
jgi:arginine decarboxylase